MFLHVAFDNVVDMEMEEDLPYIFMRLQRRMEWCVRTYIRKWSPHHTGKTYVCMGQYVFPHPALLMYGDSMCSHTQHYLRMGQYVFPHPALLMYGTVCVPTPSITYFMYAC